MFETKQKSLIGKNPLAVTSKPTTNNAFVNQSLRKAAKTTSLGNGAVKYTTTNNDFVDDFGKISNYKAPRSYAEISKTMSTLWAKSPEDTLKLLFYIRLITRTVDLPDGSKTEAVQRGQGLRHEGISRMLWLAINHKETFWKNIALFISAGSWKDVITLLSMDLQYNGWEGRMLDWKQFGQLILVGLENPASNNLLKKYLPQIKTNSKCNTIEAQADNIIAKWICSLLFGGKESGSTNTYKRYRTIKTSGTAHEWQKLISQHKFVEIDFNSIHGRALSQLVSSKFLKNAGLETQYEKWIASKPVAKYTGYVYELFKPFGMQVRANNSLKKYQTDTINSQFMGLVETAKKGMEGESGLIVVLDSSASMTSETAGTGCSAYSIGKSLALFFSYLLKGAFENHFLEFSNDTIMKTWKGSTPVEKYVNETSSIVAGTNFLSVGTHFAKMLAAGVPESDFPKGILCISDGCFNASTGKTTTKQLKLNLLAAGFSKEYVDNFKIILWDIPNSYYGKKSQTAFEEFADAPNLFYLAGFDPSVVAFLTGIKGKDAMVPKNAEELFQAAMDQELLNMTQV